MAEIPNFLEGTAFGVLNDVLSVFHSNEGFAQPNKYEVLILQIQHVLTFSTDKMKQVDSSGHYESDDETGFFFEQLKQIQLSLDGLFEAEETEDAKKKD